jgi:polysaccharide export outer membrane protein
VGKQEQAPRNHRRAFLAALCLFLGVAGLSGCHGGPIYRATSLPQEFAAPRFGSMQNVDLSRFSRSMGDNDLLYPGDIVAITLSTGLETEEPITWKGRIADDGTANVPLVGPVQLAGARLPQAEQMVRFESIQRGKFVNPNVTVRVEARRSNRVTVVGAVKKPGTYEVPANSSHFVAAISQAEGLTEDADTIIEIKHPPLPAQAIAQNTIDPRTGMPTTMVSYSPQMPAGPTPPRVVRIDLEQASATGVADVHLEDGSTVMVMPRPKRYVHVMGLVRKPDQFEIPPEQDLHLLDAIALASGRTLEVADKVRVIRQVPNRTEPIVIEISVREAKLSTTANIRLAPGDVVSVEETPTTFVIGTIRDFVRFGFTAGIPGF